MWSHLLVQLLGATWLGNGFWQLADEPRTILLLGNRWAPYPWQERRM